MDRTPATDKAIEKMLDAITDVDKRDLYPSGTTFVPLDAAWADAVAVSRLSEGRPVLLVTATGAAALIPGLPKGAPTAGAITRTTAVGYVNYATKPGPTPVKPNLVPA